VGRRFLLPVVATAVLGVAYLLFIPEARDLAAHTFRVELWEESGFSVWSNQWYGGHHLPGFSLLYPPLGALLGVRVTGVVACVVAVALFVPVGLRFARAASSERAEGGELELRRLQNLLPTISIWLFAAGLFANVVSGRMPFVLGVMFGVGTWTGICFFLRARENYERWNGEIWIGSSPLYLALAVLSGLACVFSSPVAGIFLLVTLIGWGIADRMNLGIASLVALPLVVGGALLSYLFPEGGSMNFDLSEFLEVAILCLAILPLVAKKTNGVRVALLLYLALLGAAVLFVTPLGHNANRLAFTLGPAVLVLAAYRSHTRTWRIASAAAAGLGVAFLLYLGWGQAVRDVQAADRLSVSDKKSFYSEPREFFAKAARPGDRVEVAFTLNHWEAAHLAPRVPLARGWERQLDRKYNPLFYSKKPLTTSIYREWLHKNAIQWVALPATELDSSAQEERRVLLKQPSFLKLSHSSHRWKIWRVVDAAPMVGPSAQIAKASSNELTIDVREPGKLKLMVRHTPYWKVVDGAATVGKTEDGWTELRVQTPGAIRVAARL
jgi:hypothetical protein